MSPQLPAYPEMRDSGEGQPHECPADDRHQDRYHFVIHPTDPGSHLVRCCREKSQRQEHAHPCTGESCGSVQPPPIRVVIEHDQQPRPARSGLLNFALLSFTRGTGSDPALSAMNRPRPFWFSMASAI